MDWLLYLNEWWKSFDRGDLESHPAPDPPADLGNPLTQAEIDQLKTILKEVNTRFPDPGADDPTDPGPPILT